MRYYSTQRPVMPGGFPRSAEVEQIKNYDSRTYCEEIGREAWGYIDYRGEITEQEAREYELVEAGMRLWYEVTVAWYYDGKIYAFVSGSKEAAEKPACMSKRSKSKEVSTYWYDSLEAAEEAARKTMMA